VVRDFRGHNIPKPAQLMKDMARYSPSNNNPGSAAWDAVVDHLKVGTNAAVFLAKDTNDSRCPEYFNNYLTRGAASNDCPLLTAFLTAEGRRGRRV